MPQLMFRIAVLFVWFVSNLCWAQSKIEGQVVSAYDGQGIPFANIGILNTNVGTLSNEDGSFTLYLPIQQENELLSFSSLGFETKNMPVQALLVKNASNTIKLQEWAMQLKNVVVTGKKGKLETEWMGNGKSLLLSGQLYSDTTKAGSAMALLIDKSEYSNLVFIEKAKLRIAKNKFPEFKVRIKFLEVDTANNNLPGKPLFQDNIILHASITKGWLEVDLSKYQYQISQNKFYLVFEWILNESDRRAIAQAYKDFMTEFPERVSYDIVVIEGEKLTIPRVNKVVAGTLFGTTGTASDLEKYVCYFQTNSFGEWKRSTGILSAKVKLANQPVSEKTTSAKAPCPLSCTINKWAKEFQEEYQLQGWQMAISIKKEMQYSQGFGWADRTNQLPVKTDTQFRIASVSKPMTAIGLMRLVEQGKIDLDKDVRDYVPSFPSKKHRFSVRQLAAHLSGVRDYYELSLEEIFVQKHYESALASLEIFENSPLEFEPGDQYLYSSYGYNLLGSVLEAASGQDYLAYMQQAVWDPLQMKSTYGEVKDSTMVHKSKFYYLSGEEATHYDLSYSYPSGGLLSTAEDLLRLGNALFENSFLSESAKQEMFRTYTTALGEPTGYGLGWYIQEENPNRTIYYHAGELPSTGSFLMVIPEAQVVIALIANSPIVSDSADGYSRSLNKLAEVVLQQK